MNYQYFLSIGDHQFILTASFRFKSFVTEEGQEDQIISFLL